ncbi:MAG TPA: hypothetical protein VNK95_07140, partial [Caldilineaceae bacterium]|nr:hypothetical protein [Caldilineaceae bacterium]
MHHLRLNRRAVWAFLAGWLLWLAVGPKVALAQPPDGAAQPAAQEMAHLLNATAPPVPPFVPGVVLVGVQGEPAGGGSAT